MSVELVVARYNEDVSWCEGLGTDVTVSVYNKGSVKPNVRLRVGDLPNVGREAHTYLWHIVVAWDDLADWTVFCQGGLHPHLSLARLTQLLKPGFGIKVPSTIKAREWGPDGRIDWKQIEATNGYKADPDMVPARLPFTQWLRDRLGANVPDQAVVQYTQGACFGVPASLIRSYPRELYEALLADVGGSAHPEEAHYLERTWVELFTAGGRPAVEDLGAPTGLVYACQPCYGSGNKASKRQFWSKSVDPRGPYAGIGSVFDDKGSSLLADSFNQHWVTALNMQLQGRNVTRFAMLHDDVVPEDFWLEKLLAELDRTGADLVATVVPIKDARGLVSTAVDDPDDPWEVFRRLTMDEVMQLPETFTAEDYLRLVNAQRDANGNLYPPCKRCKEAGYLNCVASNHPLLVNTGAWVCRFDRPWRHRVHFEITNRIVFVVGKECQCPGCIDGVPPDGKFLWECAGCGGVGVLKPDTVIPNTLYREGMTGCFANQVMSEDWNFSRQLARLRCDIRATRKLTVYHIGDYPWPNNKGEYGKWNIDEAMRKKWDPSYQEIPRNVDGWLLEDDGRLLAKYAAGKDVLEIGSYCGLSTIWMARVARHVSCVDPFDGRGTPNPHDTLPEFKANLERYGVQGKVDLFKGTSTEAVLAPAMRTDCCDFAFVDGAHDYASICKDMELVLRVLKPGGLIAFHDYGESDPKYEVNKYVGHLLHSGARLVEHRGLTAVVDISGIFNTYQNGTIDGRQAEPAASQARAIFAESLKPGTGPDPHFHPVEFEACPTTYSCAYDPWDVPQSQRTGGSTDAAAAGDGQTHAGGGSGSSCQPGEER